MKVGLNETMSRCEKVYAYAWSRDQTEVSSCMTPVADCKISRVASKGVEASGHEKWRSRSAIVIIQRYRSDTIILVISIILYIIRYT